MIQIGVVVWRDIEIWLNLNPGFSCHGELFLIGPYLVNPKILTTNSPARGGRTLRPHGTIFGRVWRLHSFLEVEELSETYLPEEPASPHVGWFATGTLAHSLCP